MLQNPVESLSFFSLFFLGEMRGGFISVPPDVKKLGIMSKLIVYALSTINIEVYFFQLSQTSNAQMW